MCCNAFLLRFTPFLYNLLRIGAIFDLVWNMNKISEMVLELFSRGLLLQTSQLSFFLSIKPFCHSNYITAITKDAALVGENSCHMFLHTVLPCLCRDLTPRLNRYPHKNMLSICNTSFFFFNYPHFLLLVFYIASLYPLIWIRSWFSSTLVELCRSLAFTHKSWENKYY